MRRVANNVYSEIYFWGCNPSFVVTSDGVFMVDAPQQPIDALRWRETMLEHGPIRYLLNSEPHGDHISGNAYFPGVEVIGQRGLKQRYDEALAQMLAPERAERMKETDPDSVWLLNHPDYPPNPPTRLFDRELTIELGNHTFRIMHHPGHTAPQTTVYIPEEGVAIIGDNIFSACKTFIQEADPWEWLDALRSIHALDVEVIVPGHGEPVTKDYLATQAQVIEDWIGVVEDYRRRGLSEDEALAQQQPAVDPYPIGQRLYPIAEALDKRIVSNLYKQFEAKGK